MNKYQEAYDIIFNELIPMPELNYIDTKRLFDSMDLLRELVDKATPKKVCPKWRTGYDPKLYYPKSFHCPSCGRRLRIDQFYKWCPDCNQALEKWGDEDDK